jgi:cysteine-rich repeat protein
MPAAILSKETDMRPNPSHAVRRWVLLAALALLVPAVPGAAAVPGVMQVEGVLTATGGGPVADGEYTMTFKLYAAESGGEAIWFEPALKLPVVGGAFGHVLGAQKALKPEVFAGMAAVWLGVQIDSETELPRKSLMSVPFTLRAAMAEGIDCSGCVSLAHLAPEVLAPYAKTASLAAVATSGKYADLTGAPDLAAYAKVVDLVPYAKTADLAAYAETSALASVALSGAYADLENKPLLAKLGASCGTGLVVKGLKVDGSYECVAAMDPSALPKDALDEVSNGLLYNQFNEVAASLKAPVAIPDNNPVGVSDAIDVPDFGTAQALTVSVELANSDTSNLQLLLIDPANTKYVLWDKTAKGTVIKTTWPSPTKTVSGDLSTWIGKNPKGKWYLQAIDTAFLNNGSDGQIKSWSVNVQILSSAKVGMAGALVLKTATDPPFPCDASVVGALYFDTKANAIRYCTLGVWRSLADTCGNGILETTEECDDGNNADGDGCSRICQSVCGDGKTVGKEECDDGNTADGDWCTSKCEAVGSCAKLLAAAKLEGKSLADGVYTIGGSGINPFEVYCDMTTEGGGWTLVLNLDTSDGSVRHYDDTTFWTAKNVVGAANSWASADYKGKSVEIVPGKSFLMRLHNSGTTKAYATYNLLSDYAGKPLLHLLNTVASAVVTGGRDKQSGSIGANGRARNAGDIFADHAYPVILNSRYSPVDSDNYTRLGANFSDACGTINCDGHNYGGWGGRHFRSGWGAYYEGAAVNGYCSSQGGFGSNGSAYNGNNAYSGCSPSLVDVDLAVFVR